MHKFFSQRIKKFSFQKLIFVAVSKSVFQLDYLWVILHLKAYTETGMVKHSKLFPLYPETSVEAKVTVILLDAEVISN